jgi:hypothetical protein
VKISDQDIQTCTESAYHFLDEEIVNKKLRREIKCNAQKNGGAAYGHIRVESKAMLDDCSGESEDKRISVDQESNCVCISKVLSCEGNIRTPSCQRNL